MGGDLTPGAAGLCATTYRLLREHAALGTDRLLLVLEDDFEIACESPTAVRELLLLLAAKDRSLPPWDCILLGSHPESEILPEEVATLPAHLGGSLRRVGPFFGLFSYAINGSEAASKLVSALFPCSSQLDGALSELVTAHAAQGGAAVGVEIRVLHVGTPLLASPKSSPGQTDIQRMDERSFVEMQTERLIAQGQLRPELAQHPGVTSQLVDAWRRQFQDGST